jgi:hypothetical protein
VSSCASNQLILQQLTNSTTILIDVDNGGYKKKGIKILVLLQYVLAAQKLYEEFCKLMKCKSDDAYGMEAMDDNDATQVNSNIKGYLNQLKAMFESDKFLEINKPVSNMEGNKFRQ